MPTLRVREPGHYPLVTYDYLLTIHLQKIVTYYYHNYLHDNDKLLFCDTRTHGQTRVNIEPVSWLKMPYEIQGPVCVPIGFD